jgi:hypothetical protein
MSVSETVIEGTLKPDGTLDLDQKPNLPPGRVKVVLRQEAEPKTPKPLGAEFFQMMEGIWAAQKARGHVPRTVEEVQAERSAMRGQMDDEIEAAVRLQEECRHRRKQAESETTTL